MIKDRIELPFDSSLYNLAKDHEISKLTQEEVMTMVACISLERDNKVALHNIPKLYPPKHEYSTMVKDRLMVLLLTKLRDRQPITLGLALFLTASFRSYNHVLLWAWTLLHIGWLHDWDLIDLDRFTKCFPKGYPSAKVMNKAWEAQKGPFEEFPGIQNLLEVPTIWKTELWESELFNETKSNGGE